MFSPSYLEGIPIPLEKAFRELEIRIMEDIVRRLKNNAGEIIRSADWQIYRLHELGESKRVIKKYIKDTLDLSTQEINHIYKEVLRRGYAADESLYKYKGKPKIRFEDNEPLQQLIRAVIRQTNSACKNITQSLGFAVKKNGATSFTPLADFYQNTLDGAVLDIASGAFDYNTVLKRTVKELTNSGLRTVDYVSGYSNRVPVAARRAVMTGFNQTVAKINDDNAKELETDTFEVTWHSGHRPSHWWGGGWYTKQQLVSVCGLGSVDGLCGANCYHNYYPVIPGVSVPTYAAEELEQMRADELKTTEYDGKEYTKYEALQRQRRLETKMRAQRQEINLLKEGGADEDDIIAARCRYRGTSAEYVRFSEAMGIPQQRERVTVDGLGNIGVGKWKTQPIPLSENLIDAAYDDIIHLKGRLSDRDARKWYVAHNKAIPELLDKSKTIEEQARQACDLRNMHKFQARELMVNQNKRSALDISDPIMPFESIIEMKMRDKNMTYDEAVMDVIKTSTKTRKSVNNTLGVEG